MLNEPRPAENVSRVRAIAGKMLPVPSRRHPSKIFSQKSSSSKGGTGLRSSVTRNSSDGLPGAGRNSQKSPIGCDTIVKIPKNGGTMKMRTRTPMTKPVQRQHDPTLPVAWNPAITIPRRRKKQKMSEGPNSPAAIPMYTSSGTAVRTSVIIFLTSTVLSVRPPKRSSYPPTWSSIVCLSSATGNGLLMSSNICELGRAVLDSSVAVSCPVQNSQHCTPLGLLV
mmetsp:Transcript_44101/g.105022  ORF Transcript_44101/g.105022 Transcript_44101/m.105022 type:complete len:224 (-) Transcript_44101:962-1633(-)